jgi:hypothetical protein
MATRSRTRLYKEYRDNFIKKSRTENITNTTTDDELFEVQTSNSQEIELLPTTKHHKSKTQNDDNSVGSNDKRRQHLSIPIPPEWTNSFQQITAQIDQIKKKSTIIILIRLIFITITEFHHYNQSKKEEC